MKSFAIYCFFVILFLGCANKPVPHNAQKNVSTHKKTVKKIKPILHVKPKKTVLPPYKLKTRNPISLTLYKQYKKWYKTPYKYGGHNSCGVDCSYFVQKVYADAFGIRLPRTTKYQVKLGRRISMKHLMPGDLVFFRTGRNSRHVGIVIERSNFLHVSTKHGVKISSIYNPYWRLKYWQSRRILPVYGSKKRR